MYQHEFHIHSLQYLQKGNILAEEMIMLKVTSVYDMHIFRFTVKSLEIQ